MPNYAINRLGKIRTHDPVNWRHPLNKGRVGFWLSLPLITGGNFWYDLTRRNTGTFTSMGNASNGWRSSPMRPGSLGPNVLFDGSAGYVSAPNSPSLLNLDHAPATWSFWLFLSDVSGYNVIAGKNDANLIDHGWIILLVTGVLAFSSERTNVNAEYTGPTLSTNTWYHLAVTYDGNDTCTMFLNGVSQSITHVNSPSGTQGSDSGNSLAIGANSGGAGFSTPAFTGGTNHTYNWLPGRVDAFSIWNRTLTNAELWQEYDLSRRGYPGVLNRWKLRKLGVPAAAAAAPLQTIIRPPNEYFDPDAYRLLRHQEHLRQSGLGFCPTDFDGRLVTADF